MNYLYCLYFCKKEALRKFREIEISLYSTGIMAVFTPANRDKEGYLRLSIYDHKSNNISKISTNRTVCYMNTCIWTWKQHNTALHNVVNCNRWLVLWKICIKWQVNAMFTFNQTDYTSQQSITTASISGNIWTQSNPSQVNRYSLMKNNIVWGRGVGNLYSLWRKNSKGLS